MPIVTTLHTVLEEPDTEQRDMMTAIGELSDRLVVMSRRAKATLARVYGIPEERIAVIPHGVPDMPFLDTSFHKDQFGIVGKKVILTFGLLSRGKGIEYVIDALPEIVARPSRRDLRRHWRDPSRGEAPGGRGLPHRRFSSAPAISASTITSSSTTSSSTPRR